MSEEVLDSKGKTEPKPGPGPVFHCQKCGECCRGEGGILVTPPELEAMAAHLGLTPEDFTVRYLVETPLGLQLASREGSCIMQKGTLCQVHPVKPRICREWPFLPALLAHADEFEAAKEACPGIFREADHKEFFRAWKEGGE
jgi:Fe-S-cluster containining protein